jgi:hypothetical protein
MRQNELFYGIDVYDENDNKVTQSRVRLIVWLSYGRCDGQDMLHSRYNNKCVEDIGWKTYSEDMEVSLSLILGLILEENGLKLQNGFK